MIRIIIMNISMEIKFNMLIIDY